MQDAYIGPLVIIEFFMRAAQEAHHRQVEFVLPVELAMRGKAVLLVDMDPQGHASLGLNVDPDDFERSTYDVLVD